jgi:hypothetical protein
MGQYLSPPSLLLPQKVRFIGQSAAIKTKVNKNQLYNF